MPVLSACSGSTPLAQCGNGGVKYEFVSDEPDLKWQIQLRYVAEHGFSLSGDLPCDGFDGPLRTRSRIATPSRYDGLRRCLQ